MSVTRKRVAIEGFDRISNLPKEVTDEILMCLPIRDAVKTSLLSTNWRYRWSSMPNLVFQNLDIGEQQRDKLVNFVNQALLLHNGTVSLFKLDNFLEYGCSDVDRWIVVLSRKMLNHLFLKFNQTENPYRVPGSLFSCQFLKSLTLEFCEIRLPPQLEKLGCLTVLELKYVILTSDTLETLVVKMPLLRVLKVCQCKPLTHFNIDAPKLKTVFIAGLYRSVKFRKTPKVTSAKFFVTSLMTQSIDEVLEGLDALQSVVVYIFPIGAAPERLNVTYHHLKVIQIFLDFEFSKGIMGLLCLLRSSPILQSIDMKAICRKSSVHLDDENIWEAHEADIFHHLKDVRFCKFKGLQHELKLTKFILSKAVVLETLCIIWDQSVLADGKLMLVVNMMQFQRASSKAKVIFNEKGS
ncbi:hypothetical protein ACHQM5_030417 [Ranunculus cassubicifolius]